MNPQSIQLRLGAVSPPLYDQLKIHGITKAEAKVFQDDNSAINRLYIRDFLTESETKRARKKLSVKVFAFIQRVYEERGEAPPIRERKVCDFHKKLGQENLCLNGPGFGLKGKVFHG